MLDDVRFVSEMVADIAGVDPTHGCPASTSSTAGVVTTSVVDCPDGRAVELVTVAGAGTSGRAARRRGRAACSASTRRPRPSTRPP